MNLSGPDRRCCASRDLVSIIFDCLSESWLDGAGSSAVTVEPSRPLAAPAASGLEYEELLRDERTDLRPWIVRDEVTADDGPKHHRKIECRWIPERPRILRPFQKLGRR
jgi:hypothetical protein